MKETEKKRVLITVKAYPHPDRELGEATCCAGIDIANNRLIRLYPIPFRDLASNQKFKKYSIIEADCFRSNEDNRPESFRVNCDTIRVIECLGTENKTWQKRKDIILKVPVKSMCQVYKDSNDNDSSLGIIRPEDIRYEFLKRKLSDPKKRAAYYSQLSLLRKPKGMIEEIPFVFHYRFKCAGNDQCEGHKLSIVDWEICQAYRDWRGRYPDEKILMEKIKQRWEEVSNTSKKDVLFFVGNVKYNRNTFMVLGVFYPAKST
jgi:hypothetical protein